MSYLNFNHSDLDSTELLNTNSHNDPNTQCHNVHSRLKAVSCIHDTISVRQISHNKVTHRIWFLQTNYAIPSREGLTTFLQLEFLIRHKLSIIINIVIITSSQSNELFLAAMQWLHKSICLKKKRRLFRKSKENNLLERGRRWIIISEIFSLKLNIIIFFEKIIKVMAAGTEADVAKHSTSSLIASSKLTPTEQIVRRAVNTRCTRGIYRYTTISKQSKWIAS